MNANLRLLLPLVVVVSALGVAAESWVLACSVGSAALILAMLGPRWQLDQGRQVLTGAIGGALGYVVASLMHEHARGVLSEGWTQFTAAALMAAASRSIIIDARGGAVPTIALLFLGLLGAGKVQGSYYAGFVVAFLGSSVWALANVEGAGELERRRAAVGASIIALSALLGLGAVFGVRHLDAWVRSHTRYGTTGWKPQVGFSDRMDLGALDGLLDSPKRVLRVQGPHVDYLRGVVLDSYRAGRWMRSERSEVALPTRFDTAVLDANHTVVSTIGPGSKQLFAPLAAHDIVSSPPALLVDPQGALAQEARRGPWSIRFENGARNHALPSQPNKTDMELPLRLAPNLISVARKWTIGQASAEERLTAIQRHLRSEFAYSRDFKRPKNVDPLLDFLYRTKRGHCEYFASALALLGRAAGVPTRVVMGYRVGERSPFGYHLVRERNAHAWVEAWLPKRGWVTLDATPEALLPQNTQHEAGYVESSFDALALAYEDMTEWLGRLSLGQTSIAWFLGALILGIIVFRGARRRAKAKILSDEAALPSLARVLAELERAGFSRRDDEPLEHLAARLPKEHPRELLARYAALRYGCVDADEFSRRAGEFNRDVEVWLKRQRAERDYWTST